MAAIEEGVYAEVFKGNIGTGGTAKSQEITNYYLARDLGDGQIQVQLLDMNDEPVHITEKVSLEDFQKRFKFQPGYLDRPKKTASEKTVDKAIAQAEAHFNRNEYNSAEFEYGKALKVDHENVRANFGVGKVYLATGDTEKAKEQFKKLVKIDAIVDDENKHVFNDLGIELRKLQMYDEAVEHYSKALALDDNDEHLLFNIARAYFDKGSLKQAAAFLKKSLTINPKLKEGLQLLAQIKKAAGR